MPKTMAKMMVKRVPKLPRKMQRQPPMARQMKKQSKSRIKKGCQQCDGGDSFHISIIGTAPLVFLLWIERSGVT